MIVEQAFCSVLLFPNTIKAIEIFTLKASELARPSDLRDLYRLQICWNKIALC